MDAAEVLFASSGIDAVSNRRIAEQAGSSNHSAVAYHFGTRENLLRSLLRRHSRAMAHRREELASRIGNDPTAHDLVGCRILPYVELLSTLPRPSSRAQFLAQMISTPFYAEMITAHVAETGGENLPELFMLPGCDVSSTILRARSRIVAHLVVGACADYERRLNAESEAHSWIELGYFLIDASAGMLTAPVTRPHEEGALVMGSSIL